jgi:KDO2-lipid IV(A) lauroyltransferase
MAASGTLVRHRLAYPLQALGLWLVFAMVGRLPLDVASALGGWMGRTLGPLLGLNRRARRNLERAFPDKPAAEIEAIVRGMWDNLGRTAFEFPHLQRIDAYTEASRIEVVGVEHIDALRDDGKAGIFFSGHLANWEIMPLTAARRGLPVHLFYRVPNNPLVESLIHHRRLGGQGELLAKGAQGARRALRLLTRGEHLGMLVDQKMNDGIPVPFFGRDAMTAPALAQFALRFDCPVVPSRVERLQGGRFRVTHHTPLKLPSSGDRQADVAQLMAQVNACLEDWIRRRPEQWLWLHRRWPD